MERSNFNPRAPCGARRISHFKTLRDRTAFQSTRPVRGATTVYRITYAILKFQSTRPVRGATGKTPLCHKCFVISIHAPRAGRDFSGCFCSQSFLYFNPRAPCGARLDASDVDLMIFDISIHAPRAGRDPNFSRVSTGRAIFQSTRPVRGAT